MANETKRKLISVIMPAYNGERFIEEAIRSVLRQTHNDIELIVIDDGSTDTTVSKIQLFQDSRIKLLRNTSNIGLPASLNKAVKASSGKYIARLDCDDICREDRLEKQLDYLLSNQELDVCFSWIEKFSETLEINPEWKADRENNDWPRIKRFLRKGNCLAHPSAFFRKEVFDNYSYDETLPFAEDYELWLRLSVNGIRIGKVREPLVRYRVHQSSMTSMKNSKKVKNKQASTLIKKQIISSLWKHNRSIDPALTYEYLKDTVKLWKLKKRQR